MNKVLLIWNIVITVLLLGAALSGCASMDPQFTYLQDQVQSNREAIEQLTDAINENRATLADQAQQIATLKVTVETVLK